jgi:predicted nuclease of predicted toxin-antitoxin system
MKLLLDECTPRRLKGHFPDHQVFTVDEVGLKGVRNGQLLRAASVKQFDALITVDRNMRFQQNLAGLSLAIVVLATTPCHYPELRLLVPEVLDALRSITPGDVITIPRHR